MINLSEIGKGDCMHILRSELSISFAEKSFTFFILFPF
jgi:hypothetical protein